MSLVFVGSFVNVSSLPLSMQQIAGRKACINVSVAFYQRVSVGIFILRPSKTVYLSF